MLVGVVYNLKKYIDSHNWYRHYLRKISGKAASAQKNVLQTWLQTMVPEIGKCFEDELISNADENILK